MFKNIILAAAAVASLSVIAAPAFANVPQSLIPTSESDVGNGNVAALTGTPKSLIPTSESDLTADVTDAPRSLVPTSAGDKADQQAAAVLVFPAALYYIG